MREKKRDILSEGRLFIAKRRTIFEKKLKEALSSVLPITVIVLILCFFVTPVPTNALMAFILGAVMLTIGFGLFTLGAEMAMITFGEKVGAHMTKTRKIWVIVLIAFVIGVMITASEPSLQVLAEQVPYISTPVLIILVALGVGVFLIVAVLRILFAIRLSYVLMFFYAVVLVLAFFVPDSFIPVAFDSGGVATGAMTVPFIMALGIGISSIRSDKDAESDSFGLIALALIGPIIAVLLLSFFYNVDSGAYVPPVLPDAKDSVELWRIFTKNIPHQMKQMLIAVAPIVLFFFVFTLLTSKPTKSRFVRVLVGFVYTYIGLVLFLTGVNVGFMPVGSYLGNILAQKETNWIIVPIAMVMGYFIITAEPAVQVLNRQVEEITAGAISRRAMNASLSIGVSLSLGLAMLRILASVSIMWFIVPGYFIALLLTFFAPNLFTSIAFDSGGVASGPLTATFLLPFAIGAAEGTSGDVVASAFGLVAMVTMTPLITIQVMGLYYKLKVSKQVKEQDAVVTTETADEDIINL